MGLASESYFFEHILTREAAYSALLERNRQALHSLAADTLAGRLQPGTIEEWELLGPLALHLEAAGRFQEAHARLAEQLILMAETGRYRGWEAAALAAERCWRQCGRGGQSGLLLRAIGLKHYNHGETEPALHCYEEALGLLDAAAEPRERGLLLLLYANLLTDRGRMEEAEAALLESRALVERAGDEALAGRVLRSLGGLQVRLGRMQEAFASFERALEIQRRSGNTRGEVAALYGLSTVTAASGRMGDCVPLLEEALAKARAINDRNAEAAALANLGQSYAELGFMPEAEAALEAALRINRETGLRRGLAWTLSHYGLLRQFQGRPAEAAECFKEGLQAAREARHVWSLGWLLCDQALLALELGRPEEAEQSLREALEIHHANSHHWMEALAGGLLAEARRQSGDYEEAARLFAQSEALLEPIGQPLRNHVTHIFAARLGMDQQRWADAGTELEAARRCIERMGARPDAWIAVLHAATLADLRARQPGGAARAPEGW